MASTLLGALPSEVAVMGTLTGNLHLLMVPFYRPTPTRYKILIESQAFPSDRYAATSQIEFHGYDPSEALLELSPRANESYLRDEDYAAVLKQHGSSIAFILLPGVQYYTGQALDLAKWTALGHAYGCYVGWDLAHAIGNVGLELHAWQVDCAVWCSYKYLNGGPGCIAGLFVHDQHGQITPRLKGWWGHTLMTRFQMDPKAMEWSEGAAGFRLSNPSILGLTGLVGAMHVFKKVPFSRLVEKSTWLTSYLMLLIQSMFSSNLLQILTPFDPKFRGCQVSLKILHPTLQTSTIVQKLLEMGIVVDKREPNVIRVSPTPLYNSYLDCWEFVNALKTIFESGLMVEEIH
ncbi:hypothetical protein HMI54_002563 [Coelomomyces lativittatus]|nr:hypothetical protein HMI54_002563 [Coelomomyces lativittatus]